MTDFFFKTKLIRAHLGILIPLSLLSMVVPTVADAVPIGTCPIGTHLSTLVPNSHVCLKDVKADPCPVGTAEAFLGAEICLLDPTSIPKFVTPLVIPPVMPKSTTGGQGNPAAEYNIAVRQFAQQILPGGIWNTLNGRTDDYNPTTVWSYGRAEDPLPTNGIAPAANSSFNYPAYTLEATSGQLDTVRWINELVDSNGNYLKHLFAVDQTLHWANPAMDCRMGGSSTNCEGSSAMPYQGPVPIVTHVHGAHVNPESDGYPEAWWLPAANNIPIGTATKGTLYDQYNRNNTTPGSAFYGYENNQPATTLWYHDHSLGMTRLNVYAGPAGFWLIRGGANGDTNVTGVLPGPAPVAGESIIDANYPVSMGGHREKYREIPIVIQDRSFNPDGSLFYPENRALFESLNTDQLQIPFINATDTDTISDIAPLWNPEAFFNTMVVNGVTWPVLEVAPERYRFRLLDGCNSRTLNLSMFVVIDDGVDTIPGNSDDTLGAEIPFYQIGAEQGFLPHVTRIQTNSYTVLPGGTPQPMSDPQQALVMGPAERADVIVDFTGIADGTTIRMINTAPDSPFGGFPDTPADLATSAQVMQFVVNNTLLNAAGSTDGTTTAPGNLVLPAEAPIGTPDNAGSPRRLSLNESESSQVCVRVTPYVANTIEYIANVAFDPNDPNVFLNDCTAKAGVPFAPKAALLGSIGSLGSNTISRWMDKITEQPVIGDTEEWEIYNTTEDAHPIHLHLVRFQVINRQDLALDGDDVLVEPLTPIGIATPANSNEAGFKDTVITYPGQVTRIKAKFDKLGLYVWHCHIVEHEDNEMMRPFVVRFDPVFPDIDQNGILNDNDALLLMQEINKPAPRNLGYDLNSDGAVDHRDYRFIINLIHPHRSLLLNVVSRLAAQAGAK